MMIRCTNIVFGLTIMLLSQSFGRQLEMDTVTANTHFYAGVELAQEGYATRQNPFFDSARTQFNLAAVNFKDAKQWDRFFECTRQVAYLYNHEYRYTESKAYLDSVELNYGGQMQEEFKSLIQYYGTMAWVNLQSSNFIEADAWFKKVLENLDVNPHTTADNYLWAYYYFGVMYYRIGQNDLALKYMNITEALGEKYNDTSYLARVYNVKGIISRRIGEYEKALEFYTIGYDLQRHQPKVQLTPFLNNFSWLYHHLGNDSLALFYANDGLQALKDYSDDYYSVESSLRNTKAEILIDLKRYDEAYAALSKNLDREFANYGEYGLYSVGTKVNLGLLENERGDFVRSESYYTEAMVILGKIYGETSPKLAQVYRQIANNYGDQKMYEKALENYQIAMNLLVPAFDEPSYDANPEPNEDIVDKLELLKVLQDKSSTLLSKYLESGQKEVLNAAESTNKAGIGLLNHVRQNLYYGESKQVLSGLMKPLFEQSIELAMEGLRSDEDKDDCYNRIFDAMEGSKAYVLSVALQESNKNGHTQLSDSLLNQQESLFLRIEYLSKKKNDLRVKSVADSIELRQNERELLAAREKYEDFKEDIKIKHPEYSRARFGGAEISLTEVMQNLDTEAVLIEYFAGEKNLYALSISSDDISAVNLGPYEPIELKVNAFSRFTPDLAPGNYQDEAYEIYSLLLKPLTISPKKKNLIVIPDGVLGYVPFDALVLEKVANPSFPILDYGIKHYKVNQHYLASLFLETQLERQNSGTFIGYAPDFIGEQTTLLASRSSQDSVASDRLVRLPFAKSEVEVVSTLLDGEAIVGDMASEAHFKSQATTFRFLHIASHSIVDDERPLFSKLVLSRDEADTLEDGLLHAYELYGMQIESDLVTLSACNTGVGQFKNGEGIISLARGFIYAGASSVLMSLWEVADESTSIIMESFYQQIADGHEMSAAIQEAKLDYLKHADNLTANPYYWAGFTFLGAQPPKEDSSYWPYLVIFGVIAYAAIRRRRRRGLV